VLVEMPHRGGRFGAAVVPRRRLHRLVAMDQTNQAICPRILIEKKLRRDVPEQVRVHSEAGLAGDYSLDLVRKGVRDLVLAVSTRKEPRRGGVMGR
jgi:hypothetical protein